MTAEEKGAWIYLATALGVSIYYSIEVLAKVGGTAVTEIPFVRPMITAIVISIIAAIVGQIGIAISNPKDPYRKDERDRTIYRFGEYIGGIVLATGAVGVLALTMAEIEHFWIANALYGTFLLQAVVSSVVKIVAYRRGF